MSRNRTTMDGRHARHGQPNMPGVPSRLALVADPPTTSDRIGNHSEPHAPGAVMVWRHPGYGNPLVEIVEASEYAQFVLVQMPDGVRHLARRDRLVVC